jgi:hypothetical protein
MKVRAIISFNDLEENKHRNIGDEFECSKERADYLLKHNAIEIIEEPKEEKVEEEVKIEEPKKSKKKKSSKK